MKYERWIGSHKWETSDESVDGNLSFNERRHTETQDLDDLIHWLEYANTGYPAARQSADQEEHWGKLVRNLLCEKLIKEFDVFYDYALGSEWYKFECTCSNCNYGMRGSIFIPIADCFHNTKVTIDIVCDCLEGREPDLLQYIEDKIGDWY